MSATNPYARVGGLILELAYSHQSSRLPRGARFFAANNLALPADRFRMLGGFNPRLDASEDRELCDRWAEHGFGMTFVPEAVIRHATPTNLLGFCRKHFGYGRGAFAYQQGALASRARTERIRFVLLPRPGTPDRAGACPRRDFSLSGPAGRLASLDGGRIRVGGRARDAARKPARVTEPAGVGLIGCGHVAELRHLPALSRLDCARVVALADLDPDRAQLLGERFGVARRYREPQELLADPAVEVVGVLVPATDHAELTIAALAVGKARAGREAAGHQPRRWRAHDRGRRRVGREGLRRLQSARPSAGRPRARAALERGGGNDRGDPWGAQRRRPAGGRSRAAELEGRSTARRQPAVRDGATPLRPLAPSQRRRGRGSERADTPRQAGRRGGVDLGTIERRGAGLYRTRRLSDDAQPADRAGTCRPPGALAARIRRAEVHAVVGLSRRPGSSRPPRARGARSASAGTAHASPRGRVPALLQAPVGAVSGGGA